MPVETTYTKLRAELAATLDRITKDQEIVIIRRRRSADVAMIPAQELTSLMETAHLLRSPKNAQRLLKAMQRAQQRGGRPSSLEDLRRQVGLAPKA
jgi:antitoxin YefM